MPPRKETIIRHAGRLTKAHPSDAAWDLHAVQPHHINGGQVEAIPTGVYLELPKTHHALVLSRSGLASRGIFVANAPGLIDAGYRGEITVLLFNGNKHSGITIEPGARIAQLLIQRTEPVALERIELEDLNTDTDRGDNGLGSTG